jgi:menaquinone-dependent protoporphyrinogen oxidase
MSKRLLVAYSGEFATTREIAEVIGQTLRDTNTKVDVCQTIDVRELAPYQAVVVGSAIYNGAWLPEAVEFVRYFEAMLSSLPVAYFAVSMTMRTDTPANRRTVLACLEPVRAAAPAVQPVDIGLFAGRLQYVNLPLLTRLFFWLQSRLPSGDFRDWATIQDWVREIRPALVIAE